MPIVRRFRIRAFQSLAVGALLALLAGAAQAAVTVRGGASAAKIQKAIDGLPADREHVRTVKLVGGFELEEGLRLPSYTRLDLTEATLELTAHAPKALITNRDHEAGGSHIEVVGGILRGPGAGREATMGIYFARIDNCRVSGTEVSGFSQDGIRISGRGQHTRKIFVSDVYCHGNDGHGLNLFWAIREVVVNNVVVSNNRVGLRSDHSEGSYVNVTADGNAKWGIFIRNVFGNHYTNLTASRNGGAGIYVWGMVSSDGAAWRAHANGQKDDSARGDIVFAKADDLSYGRTAQTVVTGISAGYYHQYGGNPALPHGIYFEGDSPETTYDGVKLFGGVAGETRKTFLRAPANEDGLTVEGLPRE